MYMPVSTSDMINSPIQKFFCFSVIMIPPYAVISLNIWLNIAFAKFGGTVLSNYLTALPEAVFLNPDSVLASYK